MNAFDAARELFLQGVQQHGEGLLVQAEASYRASLQHLPGRPSTLCNLGTVLLQQGRPGEALPLLDQALAAEPGKPDALAHRGLALVELGRDEEALAAFTQAAAAGDTPALCMHQASCLTRLARLPQALAACERALKLDPRWAPAWAQRGSLLNDLGRTDEAIYVLGRALELGAEPDTTGWLLAALTGRSAPAAAPPDYVAALFDGYAGQFDQHLAQTLGYQVPQLLAQQLLRTPPPPGPALDLGCGTGLMAQALQPWSQGIDGVDLSARMLERARTSGLYRQLWRAELVTCLQTTHQAYALVLAADVFIYLGDLAPVFAGVRRVLQSGGLFCFSVETDEGGQAEAAFTLRPNTRYAHSEPQLRSLAAQHGFEVVEVRPAVLRHEQRQPVAGLLLVLRRA